MQEANFEPNASRTGESTIGVIYNLSEEADREWLLDTHLVDLARRPDVSRLQFGELTVPDDQPPGMLVLLTMERHDMDAYLASEDRKEYGRQAREHGVVTAYLVRDMFNVTVVSGTYIKVFGRAGSSPESGAERRGSPESRG